ncbi:hypothetical protein [Paenibacillus harenae]|uniref:hypothetical protein n=1 Tax=Paenibacillus harenae TaxID=306543 RepID=UPI00048F39B9|nr:hypothetical protein [Paenibacillus harenae]
MSAKLKVKVRSVKTRKSSRRRVRISSSSCGCKSEGRRKQDPAVEGVQEAGKELSKIFDQLRNENVAEKLVKAIRCHDARTIQRLLDCDCRVVSFFRMRDKDCVRICCQFGRYNDVTVTFDICVRSVQDQCRRHNSLF